MSTATTSATTTDSAETRGFQAEVSKLLHLMIHSLYSNREIFLRELVSNASDACDKLRFDALKDATLLEGGADPLIRIEVDANANTLTITDNGIGMSRDEDFLVVLDRPLARLGHRAGDPVGVRAVGLQMRDDHRMVGAVLGISARRGVAVRAGRRRRGSLSLVDPWRGLVAGGQQSQRGDRQNSVHGVPLPRA